MFSTCNDWPLWNKSDGALVMEFLIVLTRQHLLRVHFQEVLQGEQLQPIPQRGISANLQ